MKLQQPILVANSCGGWVQTLLAAQHSDRLGGLVCLDAAEDPTLTLADYKLAPVDTAHRFADGDSLVRRSCNRGR